MSFRFYTQADVKRPIPLPRGYDAKVWSPRFSEMKPASLPVFPFGIWALLHYLRFFANRDYKLLLIYHQGLLVHRSCVFPRYFRFPFMEKTDLQVGDTWTHPHHRRRGLATYALHEIMRTTASQNRQFWYVVHKDNAASIRTAQKAGFRLAACGTKQPRFGVRMFGAYQLDMGDLAPRETVRFPIANHYASNRPIKPRPFVRALKVVTRTFGL